MPAERVMERRSLRPTSTAWVLTLKIEEIEVSPGPPTPPPVRAVCLGPDAFPSASSGVPVTTRSDSTAGRTIPESSGPQADLNLLAEQTQTTSVFKRRPRAAAPLPGAHQESG